MKKITVIIILLYASIFTANTCYGELKDVPSDNPAYDAINDLIDRGVNVSHGYPDGTFYGNRKITKYELAYFMGTLALNMEQSGTIEIDTADIKEEIAYLRDELKKLKEQPEVIGDTTYSGILNLKCNYGNEIVYQYGHRPSLGPESGYRLQYSIQKNMGKDASLKLDLDTMDGGFNPPAQRGFPTSIMDIEGALTADIGLENPVKIRALVGPGTVAHIDTSGIAASEDHTYYSRPRPSFFLSTVMAGYDVTTGYLGRSIGTNGLVGTSEIDLQFGKKLGQIPLIGHVHQEV